MTDNLNINTFEYKSLIGLCSIFVGASMSGKSVLIKEILFNLKNSIPNIIVICPTNEQNGDFKGIVPDIAVISNLNGGRLVQKLNHIFKRQEQLVSIYNQVNDLSVLKHLAKKLNIEDETIDGLQQLIKEYENTKAELVNQEPQPHNLDILLQKIEQDQQRSNEKLINAYKNTIAETYKELKYDKSINFSQQQHVLAKSLRINPNIVLILDDCAAFLGQDIQKSDIFKQLAFQGRHLKITTLISLQSDKTLNPQIRSQAHFIVFSDTNSLESFAKSNAIICQKTAKQVSEVMRVNKQEYIKVIYDKKLDKFWFVRAINKKPFSFGSDTFRQFCQFMQKKQ